MEHIVLVVGIAVAAVPFALFALAAVCIEPIARCGERHGIVRRGRP